MKQYGNALRRLSGTLYEGSESLQRMPIVELAGDCRVLIENHKGVVEYGMEKICVKVQYGFVCVCGLEMELARMTKDQLVITGKIGSVTIQRKGHI